MSVEISKKLYIDEPQNTRLEINMKGTEINNVVVNTIKRAVTTYVPIYVWDVIVNKNTSVFNNDYMRLRLQMMPLIGIENNEIIYVEEKKEEEKEEDDDDELEFTDSEDKMKISGMDNLTMYLDYANSSSEMVTVSTDDCIFYYKGKKIPSPYKQKLPIIKLKPGQEINFSCISKLGIEKQDAKFSPVASCAFKQNKENEYEFYIESRGQIDEKTIIKRGLLNVISEINRVYEKLPKENKSKGRIEIGNADHTVGNLLSYYLYKNDDVKKSFYSLKHPLDTIVYIDYELKKGELKEVMKKTADKIKDVLELIIKKCDELKL